MNQHEALRVERAAAEHWRRYKALRLAALADAPDAFFTRYEDERDRPDAFWTQRLGGAAVTLLAVLGHRDVGVAVVAPLRDNPTDAGLFSVWVAPDARGQGVGEAVTRAAIGIARTAGHGRLVLEVSDHNAAAIALYARLGFVRTGVSGAMPPPRQHVREHERALAL